MKRPSNSELNGDYFKVQIERTLKTLDKIMARGQQSNGRVVPDVDDLPIHAGRRLEATVMFLDISKFSNRPSETPEEQATIVQVLSLFFTEMIRIIEDYDGVVEKNTGDGLMAYFGSQAGSDTSIQTRALAAALTMFSAASDLLNPILIRSSIPVVDFRICLDHGHVTIAKVGAEQRFNGIVAVGTTANVAAKMLAVADPNTILLGANMLFGLPESWVAQYATLKSYETGWQFRSTGLPYTFWAYNGRWKIPTL